MITKSRTVQASVIALVLVLVSFFACIAHGAELKDASGKMRDVAVCTDGAIYSNSTGRHQGACRGHKGVAKWLDGSAVKAKSKGGHYRKAGTAANTVSELDFSVIETALSAEDARLPTVTDKGKL